MSSRNADLTAEQREASLVLYRALLAARAAWADGERRTAAIKEHMNDVMAHEPLAQVEYVSVADRETLAEIEVVTGDVLVSLAVRIGPTRLIDNILLP